MMSTVIHKLRIRSPERDTHAVAARVAAQLNAAELAPAALPPGATLVVRRIGSGLPPWRLDPRSIRPPAEWQAAVSKRLDSLLRRAVRARRGAIPDDAEAILFLDEADLLAAMALDWMGGSLFSHWCWRSLFPHGDLVDATLRAWVDRPECVPAAIEQLTEARRAGTFVQRLPEPVLESLVRGIIRVFAPRHLEPVFEAVFHGVTPPAPQESTSTSLAHVDTAKSPQTETAAIEPPQSAAPAELRFIPQTEIRPVAGARQAFFLELADGLQRAPRTVLSREWASEFMAKLAAPSSQFVPPTKTSAPRNVEVQASSQTPVAVDFGTRVLAADHSGPQLVQNVQSAETASSGWGHVSRNPSVPPLVAEPPIAVERLEFVEIQTEFGGIFYLINLAIYLGYYSDFSAPEEPGINLLLWDFLAQTGRELAGRRLLDDPVWRLIESLGEGEEWEQLQDAMVRIREWLTEALGEREDMSRFVLEHSARVRLTATRLDIFLSLQELPIEIRIARLDRDPGWVPAAGRFVAFHFL